LVINLGLTQNDETSRIVGAGFEVRLSGEMLYLSAKPAPTFLIDFSKKESQRQAGCLPYKSY